MKEDHKPRIYLAVLVGLLTFIIYLPALRNDFVNWDDDLYVTENFHIRSLSTAFFRWAFFDFRVSYWHPLTWTSHALDYALWGLNPIGHHLSNIILHTLNTTIVILLTLKLLDNVKNRMLQNTSPSFLTDRTALIVAGATGLLFGIHPIHVESVAWLAERKDLLCAFFYLLSIIAYTSYVKAGQTEATQTGSFSHFFHKSYLSTLGFFVLALMSKPMAVTLPIVLLILDWYPMGRIWSPKTLWAACVEKVPLIALSLGSSLVTVFTSGELGAIVSVESASLPTRILVAGHSLFVYLWKMVVPASLLPFYPHPQNISLFSPQYLLTIGFVIGMTVLTSLMATKQKVWIATWGYYVVTLMPVLGIIQVGGQSMADRFTYLPSLGPFLVVGLLAAKVIRKTNSATKSGLNVHITYLAGAVAILAILSYLTIGQIAIWRTSIDLWSFVIRKEPHGVALAYYNRGQVFMNKGQIEKAIRDYSEAIALNPLYREAIYNRGIAYEKIGAYDLAIRDYDKVLELNPSNYQALNNRGILYGKYGSYDLSIECFNRALAINPKYPESYYNRGLTFSLMGKFHDAMEDFSRTIDLNPQFAQAYFQRGNIYLREGQKMEATADFRKACDLGMKEACTVLR